MGLYVKEEKECIESTKASWSVTLDTECPSCSEDVDLLEYSDFWDHAEFDIAEHGTERTKGVEVTCPECGDDFKVDFQY